MWACMRAKLCVCVRVCVGGDGGGGGGGGVRVCMRESSWACPWMDVDGQSIGISVSCAIGIVHSLSC